MRIPPNARNAHVGETVETITDVAFLIWVRQQGLAKGPDLVTINARIRHLHRNGYGRCKPTPTLPCQPTYHG